MGSISLGANHRPLRDLVLDEIRRLIINGVYQPGERLIEERLAEQFGVSRNPVREAMRVLDTEGFIDMIPRRGAVVASLSDEEADQIFDVRSALEPLAARLAARNVKVHSAEELFEIIAEARTSMMDAEFTQLAILNSRFHELVLEIAGNDFLEDVMLQLRGRTQRIFGRTAKLRSEDAWREHRAMAEAIASGDEEAAAELAVRHVEVARQTFWRHASDGR